MTKIRRFVLRRAIRPALKPILRATEVALLRAHRDVPVRPVFIIGVPRSGTTLIYQVMLYWFRMAYICNFAASYPRAPAAATCLIRGEIRRFKTDFQSHYGGTVGRAAPNEGWRIWKRWFAAGIWQDETAVDSSRATELRATIAAIETVLGAPFISKALDQGMRIRALNAIFPQSLFIWIRRRPLNTAASVLRARRDEAGSEKTWWATRPPEYDQICRKDYLDQVCEQVYYISKTINADLQGLKPKRFIEINYEDLCLVPEPALERIGAFLTAGGLDIHLTGKAIPKLRASQDLRVPRHEQESLKLRLQRLHGW